jgi:hypothetical protein
MIEAADSTGVFYANQILEQLREHCTPGSLPCCRIEDWPDFPCRAYMLDISRDRVPTMEHLFRLVDFLARLRYNQLQLYTEHTFAYQEHSEVWQNASPITVDEIRVLDVYCRERHIGLVPNQNSFGHMERWLQHPSYRKLAECPDGFAHPLAGWKSTGSTLKPDADSLAFVDSLFAELLPKFTSSHFNIGGDEPWELGQGASRARVEREGKQAVYLEFLSAVCRLAQKYGKTPMVWADILLEQPDSIQNLPENTIPILWGYEADHPFAEQCAGLAALGRAFYIAPGDSTWTSYTGRLTNMLANVEAAVSEGRRHGASGILATHWGDNGHPQTWPISLPGMAWIGLKSWNVATEETALRKVLLSLLGDRNGDYADVLLDSGRVDDLLDCKLVNRSYLCEMMVRSPEGREAYETKPPPDRLRAVAQSCEDWLDRLKSCALGGEDSHWLLDELSLSIRMTSFAARRCLPDENVDPKEGRTILKDFKTCWLRRSRIGGLSDSLSKLRGFQR